MRVILWAHAALILSACIYSFFNVLMAQAFGHKTASPVLFAVIRQAAALPVLYCGAIIFEGPLRLPKKVPEIVRFLGIGVILGAMQLCFTIGIALTDANTAALFQCVEPITASIVGAVSGMEPLTIPRIIGAVLAGAGVTIIVLVPGTRPSVSDESDGKDERVIGYILLYAHGLGVSCYLLLQKVFVRGYQVVGEGTEASGLNDERIDEPLLSPTAIKDDNADTSLNSISSPPVGAEGFEPDLGKPYGPITVTAHAGVPSLFLLLIAAVIDTGMKLESPTPLSQAAVSQLGSNALAIGAVAYAVLFASVLGYSLRAWANRFVDATTLVFYNASQTPLTAIIAAALTSVWPSPPYSWEQGVGTILVVIGVLMSTQDRLPTWLCSSWATTTKK